MEDLTQMFANIHNATVAIDQRRETLVQMATHLDGMKAILLEMISEFDTLREAVGVKASGPTAPKVDGRSKAGRAAKAPKAPKTPKTPKVKAVKVPKEPKVKTPKVKAPKAPKTDKGPSVSDLILEAMKKTDGSNKEITDYVIGKRPETSRPSVATTLFLGVGKKLYTKEGDRGSYVYKIAA